MHLSCHRRCSKMSVSLQWIKNYKYTHNIQAILYGYSDQNPSSMEELYSKYLKIFYDALYFPKFTILTTFIVLYGIYWFLLPMNIIKDLSDIGYNHLFNEQRIKQTRKSRAEVVQESRRKRLVGNTPPDFPNGWFAILDSSDIAMKQVKHVSALGEHFAVFRDHKRRIHILSAICPHLGANIAIGGQIEGSCIRCPFHGWKFDGENGKCVDIPYSKNDPENIQVKRWHSYEVNTFIFVWYHAESVEPAWYPEAIPVIEKHTWWNRGRNEYYINCHIQEIPENGADMTHLPVLHGPIVFNGSNLFSMHKWWSSFVNHKWIANWKPRTEPGKSHIGCMSVYMCTTLFNRFDVFPMDAHIDQVGPGYVVMNIKTSFGPLLILQTVTPMEPSLQKVVHKMFYPFSMSIYGTVTFFTESTMFERDIMIWNHKKYEDKPLLTKEESTIAKHRRWYSQFYSEKSHRSSRKKDLEW